MHHPDQHFHTAAQASDEVDVGTSMDTIFNKTLMVSCELKKKSKILQIYAHELLRVMAPGASHYPSEIIHSGHRV